MDYVPSKLQHDFNLSKHEIEMIQVYYVLTKPGIIFGNVITTIAGFALASRGHFNLFLFLMTVLGISILMGSACVFNNVIDRHADQKMSRTKDRALAIGAISITQALIFALILGIIGIGVLAFYTPMLTVWIGALGFFFYVVMYSFWKYHSSYGTLIGSLSGAVPPLVGYTAACGHFDAGALILFLIIVLWQMPHFYAIALYRLTDYAAAAIPVLPLKKGSLVTKLHMLSYILAYILVSSMLFLLGYSGYFYLITASVLGFVWLYLALQGFKAVEEVFWAKQMFKLSLIVVLVQSVVMSVDTL